MSLLSRWFGAGDPVTIDERRWVVLDVETTGLDTHHDELLAIAAVAVQFDEGAAPRIALNDSFEAVLHHQSASTDKDNILVHGIGVGAQRAGAPGRRRSEGLRALDRQRAAAGLPRRIRPRHDRPRDEGGAATDVDQLLARPCPRGGCTASRGRCPCARRLARRISASIARFGTRLRPTRWPRPSCCCACGPLRANSAALRSPACPSWRSNSAGSAALDSGWLAVLVGSLRSQTLRKIVRQHAVHRAVFCGRQQWAHLLDPLR